MDTQDFQMAYESFLDLVEEGSGDAAKNIRRLQALLDHLAMVRNSLEFESREIHQDDYDFPDEFEINEERLEGLIRERFPGIGRYNQPRDVARKIAETELEVRDAVEDLVDLCKEILCVRWSEENDGIDRAMLLFRAGYDLRWGDRLRKLQVYLHALDRGR